MLILDTHVLVWLDEGSPRLGTEALQAINRALASGQLGVASISFWEIAMLVMKKRLDIRIESWGSNLRLTFIKFHQKSNVDLTLISKDCVCCTIVSVLNCRVNSHLNNLDFLDYRIRSFNS